MELYDRTASLLPSPENAHTVRHKRKCYFSTDPKQKFQRFGQKRWQRQHQLLKEAFLLLFVFCEQAEWEEPNVLSRVAEMHDHTHHDIPAMFYKPFVDALVHTVCGYPPQIPEPLDPQCVDDESKELIAQAWRDALAPGIKYMQSKY